MKSHENEIFSIHLSRTSQRENFSQFSDKHIFIDEEINWTRRITTDGISTKGLVKSFFYQIPKRFSISVIICNHWINRASSSFGRKEKKLYTSPPFATMFAKKTNTEGEIVDSLDVLTWALVKLYARTKSVQSYLDRNTNTKTGLPATTLLTQRKLSSAQWTNKENTLATTNKQLLQTWSKASLGFIKMIHWSQKSDIWAILCDDCVRLQEIYSRQNLAVFCSCALTLAGDLNLWVILIVTFYTS